MTVGIPDAATALPYVGDDPAQVSVFYEGVTTARRHVITSITDLSSARSNINTVWHAAEADTADVRTAGLLTTGQSIAQSLDAGIRAVGGYSEILNQGRGIVDLLREEWSNARAQAVALESRTLATPDELTSAQVDAKRLTDVLEDLERQFNKFMSTVEAAAETCSRALIAAAGGSKDSPVSAVSLASFQLAAKPKPPEGEDPEGGRWWPADKTWRHETSVSGALDELEEQLDGGIFGKTIVVPGGGKNGAKDGKTDLFWVKDGVTYVWEIKGSLWDGDPAKAQGAAASDEAAAYVNALRIAYPKQEWAVGPALDSPIEVPYTSQTRRLKCDELGILYDSWPDEIVTIENSAQGGGGILYTTEAIDTPPPPARPPDTDPADEREKDWSLGSILSGAWQNTGIPGIFNAAEKVTDAPGALLNAALDGFKESLPDGSNDDKNGGG